jgi:hypothetical protein
LRSQTAENVESAHARQHEVEDHESVLPRQNSLQPAQSVMNRFKLEALCTEAFTKKPAEFYVVIDDEHTIHLFAHFRFPW